MQGMTPLANPSPAVHVEQLDAVTVVTLSRPDVRNAVDSDTATALYQAFVAFEHNPAAQVAVFHGAHGHLRWRSSCASFRKRPCWPTVRAPTRNGICRCPRR